MRLFSRLHQIFRACLTGLLCLSLVITPQMVWAANVLLVTSLKTFETDLGNATLKVDGIDSNMRLGITPRGELTVSSFKARQVTLQFKADAEPSQPAPAQTSSGRAPLPKRINIPLPFHLLSGQIERLTIIQGKNTYQIENIHLDLDADNQAMQFRIMQAHSPWGELSSQFQMQNTAPFPVHGWLDMQQTQGELPYHLRTELQGDLTRLEITANHHYQPEARPFAIIPAGEYTGQKQDIVQLKASIGLDEARNSHFLFHLQQWQARHIHPQLAGHMDLTVTADGSLTDNGTLQVAVDAGDSRLQQQPLVVRGSATLQGYQLAALDLLAQLDQNSLTIRTVNTPTASGTSPASGPQLAWQARLPNLAQFMPGFAGQVSGEGTIQSLADGFQTAYRLSGQRLQLPQGLHLAGFEVEGQASNRQQASLHNQIRLRGLSQSNARNSDSPPIDADLYLDGSLAQHQLTLQVKDSDPLLHRNLSLVLNGSWQDDHWQAQLTQLQDSDGKIFRLAQPATMRWNTQQGFELQHMVLNVLAGNMQLEQLHYRPARAANAVTGQAEEKVQFHTRGTLTDFPVQALLAWLVPEQSAPLPANHLQLSAQWDLQLDRQLNGFLQLQRSKGDWQVYDTANAKWQGLDLQMLSAQLKAQNNQVSLDSRIQSPNAINLTFSGSTVVQPTLSGFVIENTAPLSAQLDAQIHQLAWLSRLLPEMQPAGSFTVQAQASGHIGHPQLQGSMHGQSLALQIPSQGVWLEQGQLKATLAGDQVTFDQIHFAGKTGELNATGALGLRQGNWQLELSTQLDKLQALSRVDRWVQLSGKTQLHMNHENTRISGSLNIHKGLFELPKADKPKLDEDVVVDTVDIAPPAKPSTIIFQDFGLDFGDKPGLPFTESKQFMLRGQGLNGALSGKMRLNGSLDELMATGTLELTGTYLAYGQSLNIETGRLIFSGKIPNIGLDILATRQVESTKVGIQINGSLQTPQLKLVSTPETTNENKVSLLVLGQPMSAVGSSDMALLSVAAGALLSQGDSVSLQTRIAQTIGLDSIDVRGSGPTNYAVSVGKRINSKLVVGYEKSIVGLLNVGKLTYQLTNRISVETRTGSDNALDVFYGFSFD
ncbi:translocation and assembly module TamB [Methylophilus rhizosphaerae]|uniref:Translocation and assembly module TamB n=1 Tax=Methylophilus rhizosphaerae TaxID=492660 RepID=A0A1G9BAY7_9PROT|nr:translocation/assembly module TamB domain-containing protein [Methylophilus rhizosphaerae]SDK36240.1 translocation and assembly module TamB [Methylophilus rhizosphaerae]